MAEIVVKGAEPEKLKPAVLEFRRPFQTVYYCFEHGMPPNVNAPRARSGRKWGTTPRKGGRTTE